MSKRLTEMGMNERLPKPTPLFLVVLAICAFSAPLADIAVGQEPKKEYARDFDQSFKGVQPDRKDLALSGLDAEKCIKYEAEGLRITLPAGYPRARPDVGVVTRFPVRGDFEITLDYEILQELGPAESDSSGARFGLTLALSTPAINSATLTRKTSATEIDYIAWRSVSMEPDGPTEAAAKTFKTMAKSGRLRLVRNESTMLFCVAEGAEQEFKLLDKTSIRHEDLRNIRVFGTTGDKNASLDVRVTNLRIRADAFPDAGQTLTAPAAAIATSPAAAAKTAGARRVSVSRRRRQAADAALHGRRRRSAGVDPAERAALQHPRWAQGSGRCRRRIANTAARRF